MTFFSLTMFHTKPEAELGFRQAYAPPGERTWTYVEFCLRIPYLLVSVEECFDDHVIGRDYLCGGMKEVIDMVENQSETFKVTGVKLLSPGCMNGTESYQLGDVKEIWASKNGWKRRQFVMQDGTTLEFSLGLVDYSEMELVLRV